jgi:hypothetical membrane protein
MAHQSMIRRLPAPARRAAFTWLSAGLLWFALEAIAAAAFRPPYSYARNYISDLGVPTPGAFGGRQIDSPLSAVMNANFLAQGSLFLLAGWFIFGAAAGAPGRARHAFLGLAGVYAVGNLLVAGFHGAAQNVANGTAGFHVFGAALAIVGGNAAIIVAGTNARRLGASGGYCAASVLIGSLGLVAVLILQLGDPLAIPGVWERGAVYSITIWDIFTGVALLIATRRRASAPASDTAPPASQPRS